ncbi:hypothetical protein ACHAWX_000647 [Stephanocyclus meneghinianus]
MTAQPHKRPTIRLRKRYQLITPAFLWVCAVSITLLQGKSLAFLPPVSSPTHPTQIYPKATFTLAPSSKRHDKCPPLSMVAKSGGRVIASTEQFEKEVLLIGSSIQSPERPKSTLPILVLFSAPWCGPCRLTNPVVKEIMKQYQSKLEVVEISTDDLPDVASNVGVLSIPTIQLYHGGKVMDTIVGCVAKNVLARAVDKVLEDLGMLGDDEEQGRMDMTTKKNS